MTRRKPHKFTDEQVAFIKKHVKGITSNKLTEMVNKEFELDLAVTQVRACMKNHGLKNGLNTSFKKGQKAWNKGMKGLQLGGNAGWFHKGQRAANYKPVGSERIDSKDGYVVIKVSDHGRYQDKWKLKQRVIWEEHYGKIPKAHTVIFADGDKYNFDLDNLVLVNRGQLLKLNQRGYSNGDPELLKVGINLISIDKKIDDIEIKGGDPEKYEEYAAAAEHNGIKRQTFRARLKRGWKLEDAIYAPLHSRR